MVKWVYKSDRKKSVLKISLVCMIILMLICNSVPGIVWSDEGVQNLEQSKTTKSADDWYNPEWQYRKPITIMENSGSDLTDYQVLVEVDTASLVTEGKMQNDGDDIRFTDQDGNEIPYWIEHFDNLKYNQPNDYVASWSMDEDAGSTIYDNSTNNNDGTINGATWTSGKFGSALSFDGSNDYVDCGNDANLRITGNVTIETWVKFNDLTASGHIVSFGTPGIDTEDTNYVYLLSLSGGGNIGLLHEYGSVGNNQGNTWDSNLSAGQWHYIVGVRDTQNKQWKLYINGKQFGTAYNYIHDTTGGTSGRFRINCDYPSPDYRFNGIIDEVRIYNRALSSDEIKSIYEEKSKIWVKVPSIPANGETTIYMYYGNLGASSVSDGDATFEFFDDFPGNSLNTSKWNTVGSEITTTVSNSQLEIYVSNALYINNIQTTNAGITFGRNYAIRTYMRDYTAESYPCSVYFGGQADANACGKGIYTGDQYYLFTKAEGSQTGQVPISDDDSSHIFGIVYSDTAKLLRDGEQLQISTSNVPTASLPIKLGRTIGAGGAPPTIRGLFDWIFVRKYISPEPTTNTGAEEELWQDAWHDNNGQEFRYRRPITISNTGNANNLSYYQTQVVLNPSNFDYSKTQSEGRDVRFVDTDGVNYWSIPFWIETWDTSGESKIWVKTPYIPANEETMIYMYYGNSGVSSASNGDATFGFFDDFEDGIYTDKWEIVANNGSVSESAGVITLTADYNHVSTELNTLTSLSVPAPLILETRAQRTSGYDLYNNLYSTTTNDFVRYRIAMWGAYFYIGSDGDNFGTQSSQQESATSEWREYREILAGTTWKVWHGPSLDNWDTGTPDELTLDATADNYEYRIGIKAYTSSVCKWDWIRIRKYASPEPTIIIGLEEEISLDFWYDTFVDTSKIDYMENVTLSNGSAKLSPNLDGYKTAGMLISEKINHPVNARWTNITFNASNVEAPGKLLVTLPSPVITVPVVYDERIFVGCENKKIYALNLTNVSNIIWESPQLTGDISEYICVDNEGVYAGTLAYGGIPNQGYVYKLNLETGEILWSTQKGNCKVGGTGGNIVFVSYTGGSVDDGYTVGLNKATGNNAWSDIHVTDCTTTLCALDGANLYVSGSAGTGVTFKAVSYSGSVIWSDWIGSGRHGKYTIVDGGKVFTFFASPDGSKDYKVRIYDASNGNKLTYPISGELGYGGEMAVSPDKIIITNTTGVYAHRRSDFALIWHCELGTAPFREQPIVTQDAVIAASNDAINFINTTTGEIFRTENVSTITAPLSFISGETGYVYVPTTNGLEGIPFPTSTDVSSWVSYGGDFQHTGFADCSRKEYGSGIVTIDVLDGATNQTLLTNISTLADISNLTSSSIRLKATFQSDGNVTPILYDWYVYWRNIIEDTDLTLNSSDISFLDIDENGNITINAVIHNIGNSSVQNVDVRFLINSLQIGNDQTIDSIPGNSSENTNTVWTPITTGTHTITITIDPDNTIPETNETNNNASKNINVPAYYSVELNLLSKPTQTVNSGESATYAIAVHNLGNTNDTINLEISGTPAEWTALLTKYTVSLKSRMYTTNSTTVTLIVTAPENAGVNEVGTVTVTAVSQGNSEVKDETTTVTIANPTNNIFITCINNNTHYTNPDTSTTYTLLLINYGNETETDNINIEYSEPAAEWIVELEQNNIPLGYENYTTVNLTVTSPTDTPAHTITTTTVTATSTLNPALYNTTILTTIINPIYTLNITTPPATCMNPDEEINTTITIQNTGNTQNIISTIIMNRPAGWNITSEEENLLLNQSQKENISITIRTPEYTIAGNYTITVNITTSGKNYQITLNITINKQYNVEITAPEIKYALPNKETPVPFTIKNTGNINDTLNITVNNPENWETTLTCNGTETTNVSMEPNSTTELVLNIVTESNLGEYNITITCTSLENKSVKTKNIIVSVEVPDIKIMSVNYPENIKQNSITPVTAVIRNTGNVSAENVVAYLYVDGKQTGYGNSFDLIPVGGEVFATFYWEPKTEGKHNIKVVVNSEYGTEDEYSEEVDVEAVSESEMIDFLTLSVVMVIVIAVLLVISFILYTKHMKTKKIPVMTPVTSQQPVEGMIHIKPIEETNIPLATKTSDGYLCPLCNKKFVFTPKEEYAQIRCPWCNKEIGVKK